MDADRSTPPPPTARHPARLPTRRAAPRSICRDASGKGGIPVWYPHQPDHPERYLTLKPASDPSTLWLSIAREVFTPEHSAAEVAETLERLGRLRGLGGGFALGLRELICYASASPDPAQGALDAQWEALAVAGRIVRPVFRARLQAGIDALDALLRGKCTCSGCGKVMQSEGRPERSWDSLLGGLELERRQTECKSCGRHEFPAQRALGLSDGLVRIDLDVMVDVDLDGDGDVDRDDPSVDAPIIFVSTATTASSRRMPCSYRALPQACGA